MCKVCSQLHVYSYIKATQYEARSMINFPCCLLVSKAIIIIFLLSQLFVLFPLISTDLKLDVSSNIRNACMGAGKSQHTANFQNAVRKELANIYKMTLHPEMGDKQ